MAVARLRGVISDDFGVQRGSRHIAIGALEDVARELDYDSTGAYNAACEEKPHEVRRRLDALEVPLEEIE